MKHKVREDGLLSATEFSKIVGFSRDRLRRYHKMGILVPVRIERKSVNIHRYYAATQIVTAGFIRMLTDAGLPLEKVAKLLKRRRTPKLLIKLLREFEAFVADAIRTWQGIHSAVITYLELLEKAMCAEVTDLLVVRLPEHGIVLGDMNDFSGSPSYTGEFVRFCDTHHKPELISSLPVGGMFENMRAYLDHPSRPDRFFSYDSRGNERMEAGLYLVGYNYGGYGEVGNLPTRMKVYAEKHGLEFIGPVYNIFLTDELSENEPRKYLMQSAALVRRGKRVPIRLLKTSN